MKRVIAVVFRTGGGADGEGSPDAAFFSGSPRRSPSVMASMILDTSAVLTKTNLKTAPWYVVWTGLAGVICLVMVGFMPTHPRSYALALALLLALVCVLFTLLAHRKIQAHEVVRQQDASPAKVQPEGPTFQAVLRAFPDPVMVVSGIEPDDIVGRRIVFANDAAKATFRIQSDGAMLVTAVRAPEVLEAVDETLFGGISRSAVFETGGSQDRFWAVWTRPLPDAGNGTRLALVMLRDETDSRRMERMRADFLANASHELKTPLASLTGFIETLRGHAKDDADARDKFLSIMAAQADRMSRLIKDLMSLSRIELNEHIPPSGQVDLASAVMDVIDGLAPLIKTRQVQIVPLLPPEGMAVVTGERDQIIQVVQNLVDNAMKYSPKDGSVLVEVETGVTLEAATAVRDAQAARLPLLRPDRGEDNRYVVIRVSDKGPGIAREHLPRLTERFYRVEGQKSGDRLGTGLGLAIVKHIINRHRGGMGVESVAGAGTCFSAYFPMQANVAARLPQSAA